MLVAEQARGTHGFEEWLMRFHGKKMRSPIHPVYTPKENFLNWHIRLEARSDTGYCECIISGALPRRLHLPCRTNGRSPLWGGQPDGE